jgi:hypothetical protein
MVTTVSASRLDDRPGSSLGRRPRPMGAHACWSGALRTDRLPRCRSGMRHHAKLDGVKLASSRQHVESARLHQTPSASSASTAMSEIVVEPSATARPGRPGFAPGRAGTAAGADQPKSRPDTRSQQPGRRATPPPPIRGAVILGSVVGPCTSKQPLHSVGSRHQQISISWRQGTFVSLPEHPARLMERPGEPDPPCTSRTNSGSANHSSCHRCLLPGMTRVAKSAELLGAHQCPWP